MIWKMTVNRGPDDRSMQWVIAGVGDMTAEAEGAFMAKWDQVSTWWAADRSEGAPDQD